MNITVNMPAVASPTADIARRLDQDQITASNLFEHLTWDLGTPGEEFADGREHAIDVALELGDRLKLMTISQGLDHSPVEFLRRLQLARAGVDPRLPLELYAALEFGALGGWLKGPFALGFMAGFAEIRSLLTRAPRRI